ncbi:hypothetical protein TRFO_06293 [Tritrichomonas foetus]|uniref:PHD-type domain-containing protein n=1 Tax=Tritrichomonas foetus TaxID=1144522 RepID=A0A1J4K3T7_9EUKA|nr:hypothetical protein TRFO_06293 [Tritrichomonas foetus]|eukprot:OHT04412.1 hypothetical protein TRFO_06293 [Tritrichomonas foetus]
MTFYQESKLAGIQNSANQQDVALSAASSFPSDQTLSQKSKSITPSQFSSSIRSDPLPELLSHSPEIGNRSSMNSVEQNNSKITPFIDNRVLMGQNSTQNSKSYNQQQSVTNNALMRYPNTVFTQQQAMNQNIAIQKQRVTFNNNNTNFFLYQNSFNQPNHLQNQPNNIFFINNANNNNNYWLSHMTRSVSVASMHQKVPIPQKIPQNNTLNSNNNFLNTNTNFLNTPTSNSHHCNNHNQNYLSHRAQLGVTEAPRPQTPNLDFQVPEPEYFEDDESGMYGLRCICGQNHHYGLLIQCDKCQFWLHAICVCVARESRDDPFFCPFCKHRPIRCKCGNNKKYEIPIVQCAQCRFWVHKQCENLRFGKIPTTFICSQCGGYEFTLPLVRPVFQTQNKVSFVDCDRYEVIQSIPEGHFRNFVIADLNRTEIHLHETVGRYFHAFAVPIFQKTHEFWKIFIDTLSVLLNCEKADILTTLDSYACTFLYSNISNNSHNNTLNNNLKTNKVCGKPVKFSMSESIVQFVEQMQLPSLNENEKPKKLYKIPTGHICIAEACEEDSFICELPGFLLHTDELNADDGISLNCIRLYNSDLVIDMDGSSFQYAPFIQRSFHFNCFAKLYKSENGPRVGLFATRMKGPLQDLRRGTPVTSDCQLFLPLDGEIPYNIPKVEWKLPKAKVKTTHKGNTRSKSFFLRTENGNNTKSNQESNVNLSLLSAFCEDVVPPIPITLINEREASSRSHSNSLARSRRTIFFRNIED